MFFETLRIKDIFRLTKKGKYERWEKEMTPKTLSLFCTILWKKHVSLCLAQKRLTIIKTKSHGKNKPLGINVQPDLG